MVATFMVAIGNRTLLPAQQTPPPTSESLAATAPLTEADADKTYGIQHRSAHVPSKNCILTKQVYGWHPYWCGTAYRRYDFPLLSTVGYYSYEVDPATGGYTTIHQWRETKLVEMAHDEGSQVELTASLSGVVNTSRLLSSQASCERLCDSMIALVSMKKADGVCLDFEGVAPKMAGAFADLADSLAAGLHRWRKESTLSIVLHGDGGTQGYAYSRLAKTADRLIVALEPLHGQDGDKTGPIAPLKASEIWGGKSWQGNIQQFLNAGIPKGKLLATVAYYGYEWPTQGETAGAKTTGKGKMVTLRAYEAMDSSAYLQWDTASATGWLLHKTPNGYRQLWLEQVSSLTEKFAAVKTMDIAGVGIWALGYDHESDRYWNLLRGQFADCGAMQTDELAQDSKNKMPGMDGQTSAERNVWNWVWMLGGGIVAIGIIWAVKKYM